MKYDAGVATLSPNGDGVSTVKYISQDLIKVAAKSVPNESRLRLATASMFAFVLELQLDYR